MCVCVCVCVGLSVGLAIEKDGRCPSSMSESEVLDEEDEDGDEEEEGGAETEEQSGNESEINEHEEEVTPTWRGFSMPLSIMCHVMRGAGPFFLHLID